MRRSNRSDLPYLVRKIVELLADSQHCEHILGDLQEQSERSGRAGRGTSHVWRELLASIPGLIRIRAVQLASNPFMFSAMATTAAYGALVLWSTLITRPLMIELQSGGLFEDRSNYLMAYLPVRLTGVALVSGGVALLAFRQRRSFPANLAVLLIPVFLLLALPQLYFVFFADASGSPSALLWRIVGDALAIYLGASVGNWIRTRPKRR